MAAMAQNGNGLRANQASAADHHYLHDSISFVSRRTRIMVSIVSSKAKMRCRSRGKVSPRVTPRIQDLLQFVQMRGSLGFVAAVASRTIACEHADLSADERRRR